MFIIIVYIIINTLQKITSYLIIFNESKTTKGLYLYITSYKQIRCFYVKVWSNVCSNLLRTA